MVCYGKFRNEKEQIFTFRGEDLNPDFKQNIDKIVCISLWNSHKICLIDEKMRAFNKAVSDF